jgi:hypothetical protein
MDKQIQKLTWQKTTNGTYQKYVLGYAGHGSKVIWIRIEFDPNSTYALGRSVYNYGIAEVHSTKIELIQSMQGRMPEKFVLLCRFKKEYDKKNKEKLINIIYSPSKHLKG